MTRLRSISWGWFLFGLLLALSIYWPVSDIFALRINGYLFLPLMTAWLADRHGRGVIGLLLALGVLSVFKIEFQPVDYFYVSLGIPLFAYFLAVCSAIAFAGQDIPNLARPILHARWRWLRWAFALVVSLAALARWRLEWD